MKHILLKYAAAVAGAFLLFAAPAMVKADTAQSPYNGFGADVGRTDTVNVNDYSTDSWDRFEFNYQYESGPDYSYELGSPTTYEGPVQNDVYNANVRRDKNAADAPPAYGVFSGEVATDPTNPLFAQPVNPAYWTSYPQTDPNAIPVYDTLQMGINAQPEGNPMNMYDVGQTGALPNTSVGGRDVAPIGASDASGSYVSQDNVWFYESGSGSSTVTAPVQGGFLPPTSID